MTKKIDFSKSFNTVISAAIERVAEKDMKWGEDDCSLWVCDIILEATGVDLAKPLRGKYDTKLGAYRLMREFAGDELVHVAIKLAALAHLKPAFWPWKGALVGVVVSESSPSLALFWNGKWIARSQTGIIRLPAFHGALAWRLA